MSGYRARYANCAPEPATAVRAWYQMPDDTCVQVEVVRFDKTCKPMVYRLGTMSRISPFDPARLHYTNPCAGAEAPCPVEAVPVQYTAEMATPEGSVFTLGTANEDLSSVSVRHRSGTVLVNGVEMDPGEVMEWDAGDDPNGHLRPDIEVDATNGSARVLFQRGGYPQ